MKNKKLLQTLFASVLIAITFLFQGCSFMGNQLPKWQSGMFTPDGKYYVYTYGQVFVTQYQKRGGSTFSSGILTSYLQVIDCNLGKEMLEKPLKSKEMIRIETIEGDQVALWSYKIGDSEYSPAVFDLGTLTMKFSAEELKNLNPNVPLKSVNTYFTNTSSEPGIIFEADDGRKKCINPETGIITDVSGDFERVEMKSMDCYQTKSSVEGYGLTSGTRQKITKGNRRDSSIFSTDDFLNPEFVVLEEKMNEKNQATIYNNNLFILSQAVTTNKKMMQLTMLDQKTLQTKWILQLPQNDQEMNAYNKERFILKGNKMFLANSTYVLVIDLDKGLITEKYPLFKEDKT